MIKDACIKDRKSFSIQVKICSLEITNSNPIAGTVFKIYLILTDDN